mgnify:CR=1 FL=1
MKMKIDYPEEDLLYLLEYAQEVKLCLRKYKKNLSETAELDKLRASIKSIETIEWFLSELFDQNCFGVRTNEDISTWVNTGDIL